MNEKKIERIISKEFGNVFEITDEEISKMSFAESCWYLETLNKVDKRIKELKSMKKKEE